MSESEETDVSILPSSTTLYDEVDSKTNYDRSQLQTALTEMRPMDSLSLKSANSIAVPVHFKKQMTYSEPLDSLSLKSATSMVAPVHFKTQTTYSESDQETLKLSAQRFGFVGSHLEMDSLDSRTESFLGKYEKAGCSYPSKTATTQVDLFQSLQSKIFYFTHTELIKYQSILNDSLVEKEEVSGDAEKHGRKTTDAFLKFTLHFLREMKEEDVADSLEQKMFTTTCQHELKSKLKMKFQRVFEGITKTEKHLNQIFTELFITKGGTANVCNEHKYRQIETASRKPSSHEIQIRAEDLFKPLLGRNEPNRTVMTNGVAGIGKTVLTRKFTLDWAEGKANQDIQFTFPFSFRELNLLQEKKFSLVELIHHFFPETKEISTFKEFKILFIFDGLDECRLPLNMNSTETLTDVTESTSLDVLLTNLIRGNLLPSAHIWITTRPAAAGQIPPECVDLVTEVRGFTDPQKEEYFKKRIREEEQARRIISHIQSSRSLHTMCHIPVFCWISATVLEEELKQTEGGEMPKSLTDMYVHFLVVQCKIKKVKFDGGAESDPHFSPDTKKMIESLGKLAFEQLLKGNLYFYETDLIDCGIDVREASVYSGVFTQIFQEERGLNQDKMFSFIHLTVQEFLAALHVHLTFINTGVNVLLEETSASRSDLLNVKSELYQSAVDMALNSPNGHLDLFLRFLLGLSLETNQTLLRGLVTRTGRSCDQTIAEYIKAKISENVDPERTINLFHCLSELKDCSLVDEIQDNLRSGSLSIDELSHSQWSALVFILLTSEEGLDEFDLKKYSASEEALVRLLPVIKASTKAVLSCCNLSEKSCEALATVLASESTKLRDLDLSNNDLRDAGVKLLCEGLQNPHCMLETLRLSGCLVTKEGCAALASAVRANPSHLTMLDLSYNHLEDQEVDQLSSADYGPKELKVDHSEEKMLIPGLRKYACELELDPNTAHRELKLSENNQKVTLVEDEQPYPDLPERFSHWNQVMSKDGLSTTERCYWEVELEGTVHVAVAYKRMRRKKDFDDSKLGGNSQSWSLKYSERSWDLMHNNMIKTFYIPPSRRVGVYLDYPASTLSFYSVSSGKLAHLHTVHTTFTEPLYPTFRLKPKQLHCSVTLCQI